MIKLKYQGVVSQDREERLYSFENTLDDQNSSDLIKKIDLAINHQIGSNWVFKEFYFKGKTKLIILVHKVPSIEHLIS